MVLQNDLLMFNVEYFCSASGLFYKKKKMVLNET